MTQEIKDRASALLAAIRYGQHRSDSVSPQTLLNIYIYIYTYIYIYIYSSSLSVPTPVVPIPQHPIIMYNKNGRI